MSDEIVNPLTEPFDELRINSAEGSGKMRYSNAPVTEPFDELRINSADGKGVIEILMVVSGASTTIC